MSPFVCRVLENRSSNASVFFHRQLWVCIKVNIYFVCLTLMYLIVYISITAVNFIDLCEFVSDWQLLGNILSWHGILSNQMMRSLSLDGLLNRYIILGLCNSGLNKETIQKCQSVRISCLYPVV